MTVTRAEEGAEEGEEDEEEGVGVELDEDEDEEEDSVTGGSENVVLLPPLNERLALFPLGPSAVSLSVLVSNRADTDPGIVVVSVVVVVSDAEGV